ncbi:PREDICTED: uncharacterized protein LOC105566638 [Vollenhovia emeryi]|uniref:uncharacterized protein LOC105566638 n=1 Tax=Vollenhovia emeryi TaxID=411798 RepID=UPI0005F42D57|nr:PREDICTED: uncharacterized protein LOC105566638 [Vollenhovia emeryi]
MGSCISREDQRQQRRKRNVGRDVEKHASVLTCFFCKECMTSYMEIDHMKNAGKIVCSRCKRSVSTKIGESTTPIEIYLMCKDIADRQNGTNTDK